jgi:hypothetical protein
MGRVQSRRGFFASECNIFFNHFFSELTGVPFLDKVILCCSVSLILVVLKMSVHNMFETQSVVDTYICFL